MKNLARSVLSPEQDHREEREPSCHAADGSAAASARAPAVISGRAAPIGNAAIGRDTAICMRHLAGSAEADSGDGMELESIRGNPCLTVEEVEEPDALHCGGGVGRLEERGRDEGGVEGGASVPDSRPERAARAHAVRGRNFRDHRVRAVRYHQVIIAVRLQLELGQRDVANSVSLHLVWSNSTVGRERRRTWKADQRRNRGVARRDRDQRRIPVRSRLHGPAFGAADQSLRGGDDLVAFVLGRGASRDRRHRHCKTAELDQRSKSDWKHAHP